LGDKLGDKLQKVDRKIKGGARKGSGIGGSPRDSEKPETSKGDELLNGTARALYDYTALTETELTFKQGDLIRIVAKTDDFWWDGELNGKTGYVPSNYIKEFSAEAAVPATTPSNDVPISGADGKGKEKTTTNGQWQKCTSEEGETCTFP